MKRVKQLQKTLHEYDYFDDYFAGDDSYTPFEDPRIDGVTADDINTFLLVLPEEHRFALLVGLVDIWGRLGADQALFESLAQVTGLTR